MHLYPVPQKNGINMDPTSFLFKEEGQVKKYTATAQISGDDNSCSIPAIHLTENVPVRQFHDHCNSRSRSNGTPVLTILERNGSGWEPARTNGYAGKISRLITRCPSSRGRLEKREKNNEQWAGCNDKNLLQKAHPFKFLVPCT